jgi:hypothetical protein
VAWSSPLRSRLADVNYVARQNGPEGLLRGLVVPPKRSLQHTRGRAIAIRAVDWDRGQVEANIGIALSGLNAA